MDVNRNSWMYTGLSEKQQQLQEIEECKQMFEKNMTKWDIRLERRHKYGFCVNPDGTHILDPVELGGLGGPYQTLEEQTFLLGPWFLAQSGDYPGIKRYLDLGGEPNLIDSAGYRPLHYAARNGYEYITRELINHGALVDARTRASHQTALHRAAQHGSHVVVKLLLDAGAFVCATDIDLQTPLHKATKNQYADICEMLVDKDPKCLHMYDKFNMKARHYMKCTDDKRKDRRMLRVMHKYTTYQVPGINKTVYDL